MTSWKQNLRKLHNGVFKAAESRINAEVCPSWEGINRKRRKTLKRFPGLPLAGGDKSIEAYLQVIEEAFAPRRRGLIGKDCTVKERGGVCPS